jgi:hypothetical protein
MKADIAAIRARNERRRQGSDAPSACVEDIDALLDDLDHALTESARLREEHADLHASSMMWANLYSACAGALGQAAPAPDESPPPHVLEYSRLLESIRELRDAVDGFRGECVTCAPWDLTSLFDMTPREMCDRCLRAVSALRRSVDPREA